jgi:DNA (cytosine-5)-methyltransferase 1
MFTFIDLFSGIGGFHIALKKLKGKCLLACDINKNCQLVYNNNFGITPHTDITKLNISDIPNHDILVGGFPCQSFSQGGNKKGFEEARGLLFNEIIRIAKDKKPKYMILENVKHIKKIDNGNIYKYIYDKLNEIGYKCFDIQLSPDELNIPQNRERVFFIIIRNDLYKPEFENIYNKNLLININKIKNKNKNINIFEPLNTIQSKYFISTDLIKIFNIWNKLIKKIPNYNVGFPIIPDFFYSNKNVIKDYKRIYQIKNKELGKNKNVLTWYNNYYSKIKGREIYKTLEWQAGPIKQDDSIYNYFIQLRQSGIRVKKINKFPTLVAIVQIPIYGKEKRYLTPKECARLQSFPDNFKFLENDNETYKQLGNSVNTEVVYCVTKTLLETIIYLKKIN